METAAWLIEQHLTMSQVAFSRDIGDPKTVRDFANIVQSPERLKLLLVLTVADIRAVGPGIWNGWKGQLCAPSTTRPSRWLPAATPSSAHASGPRRRRKRFA